MLRRAYAAPHRRGPMPQPAVRLPAVDRLSAFGITTILFACIFLQRFALPVGSTNQVAVSFILAYAVFGYMLLRGRLLLSPALVMFFCGVMAMMTISLAIADERASLSSFVYLFAIYVLYAFKLRYRDGCFEHTLHSYQNLMIVAALFGIAQFASQFVLGADVMFPIDAYIPQDYLYWETYHVMIPLAYESEIMKSNGVFFLEPSFFSQFVGLSIIIELTRRQSLWRLIVYCAALVVSYSGTGLSMVVLFLPWILYRRGNIQLLVWGFIVACFLIIAGESMNLAKVTNRLAEFSEPESSGFARFISPIYLIRDFLLDSARGFFFGFGPGSIADFVKASRVGGYLAHDPTWIKLLFEYGVFAFLGLLAYVTTALTHGNRDKVLCVAIIYLYLFLGGYLLNGTMHAVFIALVAWHSDPARALAPVRRRPRRWLEPATMDDEPERHAPSQREFHREA
jgi:hypothetical protein